ncbi:ATP-dependent RNA helicase DDX42 [Geodia barretti]|uniref:RNA helicase n=1 Tax=Geodia barretti TaxID=519541 RepID=A0AA35WDE3_GEOBA|nr:ATP-dependent RNA helicase DDX42 [Geodia barretti]
MSQRGRKIGFGFEGFSVQKPAPVSKLGRAWTKEKTEEEYFNDNSERRRRRRRRREGQRGRTEIVKQKEKTAERAVRDDIEEEDDQETYFKAMANAPIVVAEGDEDIELDYDSDGYPIIPDRAKVVDPLPPVDHSEIEYPSFTRDFYSEHNEISTLTSAEVKELRSKLGLKVTGYHPPKPCVSFAHFNFDNSVMDIIRKMEYSQPTGIQAQAIPAGLGGRDIIGIAKTGSGKTAAFLLPMIVHCIDQPEIKEGDGPIALVCAPTRELCQQIYHEARKFGKSYNLTVTCVYGGGSKWEQSNALKEGCEILVATPGRLIDLVRGKATNLQRVTYLVFDEADRMFDMGFEAQVRSIANHVRPDRQTMLFSATFRKKVEKLCRDVLADPVRIVVGGVGEANEDITQVTEVMNSDQDKIGRPVFAPAGSVLVFVTRKVNADEIASSLESEGHQLGLLHGDMTQGGRDDVITAFRRKEFPILVATDIAARGLDIPLIKTVVNFDVARNIDTHVHRIGRTGRAGEKGTAFTLLTPGDVNFAGDLVRNLETAGQYVSEQLLQLAMQNPRFKKSRSFRRGGRGGGRGGGGGKGGGGVSSAPTPPLPPPTGGTLDKSRTAMLKEAMKAQYRSRFTTGSTLSSSTSSLSAPPSSGPAHLSSVTPPTSSGPAHQSQMTPPTAPPPVKKKRKSRWD